MHKFTSKFLYKVIFSIIDKYFFKMHLDDIGILASDMAIAEDESSALGRAAWHEWTEGSDGKREEELPNKTLTIQEGYDVAIRFLSAYADRLESRDIKEFIDQLTFEKWEAAVKEVAKKE